MKIRRLLLLVAVLFSLQCQRVFADEGMWMPQLLSALNESEMQALGMKLSAEDIYSVNHSSLKDAIVSFSGYCTGELISSEGLLLTNHHCGYRSIQSHSSVENDLLTDGFWAADRSEELPDGDLFVTFIVRIEDVTGQVLEGITNDTPEQERAEKVANRIESIQKEAVEGTHYGAKIKPFFYGNEYYMFITETYNDVRLVGAPPSSIGKFGGDTDNWMFPRHTGDFSLFRVYTGPDGKPAKYSPDNVPLKPKYHLPVSMDGIQKGDFTMVFGFPGRTQEYLPSVAVKTLQEETNPHRIALREQKLDILNEAMQSSDEIRIQYAAKYASTANYYKKWIGENNGLERLETVKEKRKLEERFQDWVQQSPLDRSQYAGIIEGFEEVYDKRHQVNLAYEYLREAVFGVDAIRMASRVNGLYNTALKEGTELEKAKLGLFDYAGRFYKDYNQETDEKVFAALMKAYADNIDARFQPEVFREAVDKYDGNFDKWANKVYKKSNLTSAEDFNDYFKSADRDDILKLTEKDPMFELYKGFMDQYQADIRSVLDESDEKLERLNRLWLAGLREMQSDKKFYPDANSTLRVAYGQVNNYIPKDGVEYSFYTTLEGIIQKEDTAVAEFHVPEKLKELYWDEDYGQYANDKGEIVVCFTASNHTTGGNSGSPVINAEGELIGLNFDRNWEGTMSDIDYDPVMCRNIAVDVRYILFIVDKFAGAGHLVEEMTLVSEKEVEADNEAELEMVD